MKNEINIQVTKQRFEAKDTLNHKQYGKIYNFFAYTFPFYYVFYILERLKIIEQRPWKVKSSTIYVGRTDK